MVKSTVTTPQAISRRRRRKAIVRMSRGEYLVKVIFFCAVPKISSSMMVLRFALRSAERPRPLQDFFAFTWPVKRPALKRRRIDVSTHSRRRNEFRDLRNEILRHHKPAP